jgi:hypothetical protein
MGRRGSSNSRSALLERVLPQLQFEESTITGLDEPKGVLHFVYGSLSQPSAKAKEEETPTRNPFLQKSEPVPVQIEVYKPKAFPGQSNQSAKFVFNEDEREDGYVQMGNVLHNVFATIHSTDDIDKALLTLENEGIIYDQKITRQKLEQLIRKRLADPRVADWFSGRWTVYNECSILLPDGDTRRPDRVMTDGNETIVVDFKFARERDEYRQQVHEYMQLLRQMGMPGVKGFLWYVYSNKIEKVD